MKKFDFSGWATKANVKCSDGRTILKDAFKHCDGKTVPLVWMHQHNDPTNVLGHALLENREEGVYAYCTFNETEKAKNTKELVQHGDVCALSIYANQLKQDGGNVLHGQIRELSVVLAGANPGAYIDSIISHGEASEEEAVIYSGEEEITLCHAEEESQEETKEETNEEVVEHSEDSEETVAQVIETMNEKQKAVLYALVGEALAQSEETKEDKPEGGNETIMKHNVFDKETNTNENVLSHSDFAEIIKRAKSSSVGSFKEAVEAYCAENNKELAHSTFNDETIGELFPDYKDAKGWMPETITRDLGWVSTVMNGVSKSPYTRVRSRQIDARSKELRAKGYKKGEEKTLAGNLKLLKRTTDPQTVYRKDELHRDDILDITDFDVVKYQYGIMEDNLKEDIALAIMVGDGRDEGDADKIAEDKIRPIWKDDELYTIHKVVDFEAAKANLQGTNTTANFGEQYIKAEAIIQAALEAKEQYKGKGKLDFYCTPRTVNTMLLAKDLNGRRIYNSVADLKAALDINNIHTVEQFENLTRDVEGGTRKLVGLFVNLNSYQLGATKGGQITRFEDFDIDFNKYKYLIETRLSGALVDIYSAIALEEPTVAGE